MIHIQSKRTKAVVFCMINKQGLVLLEKKTYDHPNEPNLWVFPGGTVKRGETTEEAVYREVSEEFGVSDRDVSLVCISENSQYISRSGAEYHMHYYYVQGWTGEYSQLDVGQCTLATKEEAKILLNNERARLLEQFYMQHQCE